MISLPAISITRHSYTNAASSFYGTRGNNRSFSSLSPRCGILLVIILISINNANLSLRGIIPGNDLESESRYIVDSLARVRGEDYIVHPASLIDRQ